MKPKDLKAWRAKHGLSQGKFAELIGMSLQAVKHWEQDLRSIPPLLAPALKELERQLKKRSVKR